MSRLVPIALSAALGALLAACAGAPAPSAETPRAGARAEPTPAVTEAAVCAGEQPRPLRVSAGRDLPDVRHGVVAAIHVQCDAALEEQAKRAIRTRAGAPLDRAVIRNDIETLWALGLFEDIAVRAEQAAAGLELTYELTSRPDTGEIFLRGVDPLPDQAVVDAVQLRKGEPFDPQQLEWTVLSLGEALQARGYRFVEVQTHQLRTDALHLCVEVTPGPKVTIAAWTYEGARRFTAEELSRVVDTRDGTVNVTGGVYRPVLWETEALRLLSHYYDHGYVEAQIGEPRVETSADRTRLTVTVPIEEGREYRVGEVTFSGGALVAGTDYAGALELRSGQVFSRTKAMADMARLRELQQSVSGWAPDVEVTPVTEVHPDRGLVDIEYQIQ